MKLYCGLYGSQDHQLYDVVGIWYGGLQFLLRSHHAVSASTLTMLLGQAAFIVLESTAICVSPAAA